MEQLKKYESPEMEIIPVDESDVIVTSGLGGGFEQTGDLGDLDFDGDF